MASRVFLGLEFNFIYGLNAVPDTFIKGATFTHQALQQCIARETISIKRCEKR